MAIDSALKRTSAIGISLPFRGRIPFPDGAIGEGDRFALAYYYLAESVPLVCRDPWKYEVCEGDSNWEPNPGLLQYNWKPMADQTNFMGIN